LRCLRVANGLELKFSSAVISPSALNRRPQREALFSDIDAVIALSGDFPVEKPPRWYLATARINS
jgi:hypothetical protein